MNVNAHDQIDKSNASITNKSYMSFVQFLPHLSFALHKMEARKTAYWGKFSFIEHHLRPFIVKMPCPEGIVHYQKNSQNRKTL